MTPPIRRIRADEGASLRAFRLRALAEAPTAFGSTLARESAFTDATWRERAERGASAADSVTFVAEHAGRWVGLATGLAFDPEVPDDPRPELVAMFVAPEARGRALGEALVDAVVDWAKSRRATGLCLWVAAGNAPAIRLYEKCRFRPTGEEKPLAHSPALTLIRMARDFAE
ncbi:MAG TPA: GNAT family N-acetyltransferase [Methylomirabilota bacterium]|nr:GNAT family N-acetyltransferase [Methylomirabilota bacterium]